MTPILPRLTISDDPAPADPVKPKPPRAPRTKPASSDSKKAAPAVKALPSDEDERAAIAAKVAQIYTRLSVVAGMVNRTSLAESLKSQADECAACWLRCAERNAKVRKVVWAIDQGNAYLELAVAHAPILMATLPESALDRLMTTFTARLFSAAQDNDE
jgi:hypothetical protein